jgi:alkylation response protein AidB-like acyl-CoA dehydrogenase
VTTNTGRRRCCGKWWRRDVWAGRAAGGSTATAIDTPGLTDIQRQIVELARDFARTHIAPKAAEWDRTKEFPRDTIMELGKLGFLGMATPEEWDGMGIDTVTYLMALEEIAAADAGVAVTMSIQNAIPTVMLTQHGTKEQKERWLRPLARGEIIVGFALSEPDSGSDPASMRAQAVRSGDGWVLNGLKAWATNGGTADLMMIMVRTDTPDARRGAKGISTFIVPTDTPGYKPGKPEDKMGLRASNTATVALEELKLPAAALLGDEGMGFVYAMEGLDAGRLGIAAQATGIARRALEHALEYTSVRQQFGKPIDDFQAVQFKLADMATRVEAARALAHTAGSMKDRGQSITQQAAMAKLFASETAMWVTTQAVQLFGGYGYMRDYPVERLFRDAKVTEIYEGTSEIQRIVIARGLGAGADRR